MGFQGDTGTKLSRFGIFTLGSVPAPGGSPRPSGGMLMSQPAISAGVAGRPSAGVSRAVVPAQPPTAMIRLARANASRVDILDLTARLDGPGLDRVVVEDDVCAVLGDQPIASGLEMADVVRRATLEYGRGAVPLPGDPEARQRVRQHGG